MKIYLTSIIWYKEKIHWKRMKELFNEMEGIGGKTISYIILVSLISIFHYLFSLMHIFFECYLFLFNNNRYKSNLKIVYNT